MKWLKKKNTQNNRDIDKTDPGNGVFISEGDKSSEQKVVIGNFGSYLVNVLPQQVIVVVSFLLVGALLSYGIIYGLAVTHTLSSSQIKSITSEGLPLPGVNDNNQPSSSNGQNQQGSSSGASSVHSQSSTPSSSLKTPIVGLLDRHGFPSSSYLSIIHAYVVQVNWADLQFKKNGPITTNNVIDQAITKAKQYNMELKIRVYGGVNAPSWAKNLDGTPIQLRDAQTGQQGSVGRFWASDYGQVFQTFENELAAKYDNVPQIHEVVVARCVTFTDEPFITDTNGTYGQQNLSNLTTAGYSTSVDENCIKTQLPEMSAWKHTLLDLAFNPYQALNGDDTFTYQVMLYCRHLYGKQCVLENNSLDNTRENDGSYAKMYSNMKSLGAPIAIQTAMNSKITDLTQVLQYAKSIGAESLELPNGYTGYSLSTLSAF